MGRELSSKEEAFARLGQLTSRMDDLAEALGANRLVLGEWSDEVGRGRIVSLRKTDDELAIALYQTDSRQDFDTRIVQHRHL